MHRLLFAAIGIILLGCTPSVRPIEYGVDSCSYCKMTIVDARFAAELVTTKGKVFTYDAIECLVNNLHDHNPEAIYKMVVHSVDSPEIWIDATQGNYVIHPKIQSPMGANLASFINTAGAKSLYNIPEDSILTWQMLKLKTFSLEQ